MSKYLWTREPFYGGCHYFSDAGHVVTGYYSPNKFESDCDNWTLDGNGHFRTAEEAMNAAK